MNSKSTQSMNLAPRENVSSKYEEQKIKTCKTMNKKQEQTKNKSKENYEQENEKQKHNVNPRCCRPFFYGVQISLHAR